MRTLRVQKRRVNVDLKGILTIYTKKVKCVLKRYKMSTLLTIPRMRKEGDINEY